METYFLKDNITLLCLEATSFPEGITDAFDRLNKKIPSNGSRKRYGISHGTENGGIIYRAAVEQVSEDDAAQLNLDKFVLKKGEYVGSRIINYPEHMESIGKTFNKLLANPRLDPNGCCVEIYLNGKDVQCMVRLEGKS
jgi:hypothetical protein